jgi:hypothetical protein
VIFKRLIANFKESLRKKRIERARKRFVPGAIIWAFVAHDIKRELKIIDVSEFDSGYIVAAERLRNVLYEARGLAAKPFSEPKRMTLDEALSKFKGVPGLKLPME